MKYTSFGDTGMQVSQMALGKGNFGTGWGYGADVETSKAISMPMQKPAATPSILQTFINSGSQKS